MEYFKIDLLNDRSSPLLPKITQNFLKIHLTKNAVNYETRDKEFSIMFTNRKAETYEINSLDGGSIITNENSKIILNLSKDIIKYNGLLNCEMTIVNKKTKEFVDRAVFIIMLIVDTNLIQEMQSNERYETLESLITKVEGLDEELTKNVSEIFLATTSELTDYVDLSKQTINTSVSTAIEEIDNKVENVYSQE